MKSRRPVAASTSARSRLPIRPTSAPLAAPSPAYLLGLPDSANRSNSQELRLRNLDVSPYLQDDIKLSPKLTVNLGLRWDIQVPFTENNNLVVFLRSQHPGTNPAGGRLPGAATQLGTCHRCAGYNRADIHWATLVRGLASPTSSAPKWCSRGASPSPS